MGDNSTIRSKERRQEDQAYMPVIIKRNDEDRRHPDDILAKVIAEGVEQHERSNLSLYLSALTAGLILGFAAMSVAIVLQVLPNPDNLFLNRLVMALVYPMGFIICIISGTELFTEHTATAVYPVLDRKASLSSLVNLWIIVLIGNLTGTLISAFLMYLAEPVILAQNGFIEIAHHLLEFSFGEVFISAVLAGWLMAQGGWLIFATKHGSSQIVCIYIVTFIIGLGSLHHSIAGSAEIFYGLFAQPNPDYFSSFKFLVSAIFGNLIGGSFFVAILNYAHIKKTQ